MKKLLLLGISLSILAGCTNNSTKSYKVDNSTLVKASCPKIFIGSELDTPSDQYNLIYLASTSTKSY